MKHQKAGFTILWLFAFVLLNGPGCAFKKDNAPKAKPGETPTDVIEQIKTERAKEAFNGQLTADNVQVTFTEAEMGFYNMAISWPSEVAKVQIIVNEFKEIVSGSNTATITVVHSQAQKIELTAIDSFGAPISVYTHVTTAPVDTIIDKPLYLGKGMQMEANRMYILEGAFIQTNGHLLSISVKSLLLEGPIDSGKLFVNHAHIRTQSAQNYATDDFHALNSSITINAHKAVGTLRVAMIGFNGRNGRNGDELEKSKGIIRQRNPQLDGANGTDEVSKRIPKTPDSPAETVCVQAASDGQNGKSGAAGTNAENGQDGGSTGNLLVTVLQHDQFALEIGTLPGKAGKGGVGAQGHEGGNGGAPGQVRGTCAQKPQAGQKGAQGPNGVDGKDGINGKVGTINSNVAKQRIFDLGTL
ncbi:hypothetical protein [Bdellovibrio bacteriovorus]|uniref:Uncharacterized protein n=1 Tax=Bdellovibrio bacteriovorus str. Tiberius TaxID=1069642 RepID=K7Z6F6_BDEBC|nr:hypothetical protein [Bdellovibrio bacteriovorus]AFX99793.1 hypothetical protein Bdt_0081 [Bdellovibrio bacteriovorus str. Tiberius]